MLLSAEFRTICSTTFWITIIFGNLICKGEIERSNLRRDSRGCTKFEGQFFGQNSNHCIFHRIGSYYLVDRWQLITIRLYYLFPCKCICGCWCTGKSRMKPNACFFPHLSNTFMLKFHSRDKYREPTQQQYTEMKSTCISLYIWDSRSCVESSCSLFKQFSC